MRRISKLAVFLLGFGLCSMAPTAVASAAAFRISGSGADSQFYYSVSSGGGAGGALVGHGSFGGSFISEGFPPGCPYTSTPFYGSLNLTAAEGDTLYEQISGTVCEVSSSPWTFDTPSTYTITGGTGLFRNATGSGTFDGKFVFDNGDFPFFSTGPTSFTEDGTINLNRRLG